MKKLKPIDIDLDGCIDADNYRHRLTECIEHLQENTNVVNLVKIRVGDNMSLEKFSHVVQSVAEEVRKMHANNCIYVPLKKGFIEDVTIDYIEVVDDELDNRAD
jgi:hypothetical protein